MGIHDSRSGRALRTTALTLALLVFGSTFGASAAEPEEAEPDALSRALYQANRWYNLRADTVEMGLPFKYYGILDAARRYAEVAVMGLAPRADDMIAFTDRSDVGDVGRLRAHGDEFKERRNRLQAELNALVSRMERMTDGMTATDLHRNIQIHDSRMPLQLERNRLVEELRVYGAQIEQIDTEIRKAEAVRTNDYYIVSHRALVIVLTGAGTLLFAIVALLARGSMVVPTPIAMLFALPFAALLFAETCIQEREFATAAIPVLGSPYSMTAAFLVFTLSRLRSRGEMEQGIRFVRIAAYTTVAVILAELARMLGPGVRELSGLPPFQEQWIVIWNIFHFLYAVVWSGAFAVGASLILDWAESKALAVLGITTVALACSLAFQAYQFAQLTALGPLVGASLFLALCLVGANALGSDPGLEAYGMHADEADRGRLNGLAAVADYEIGGRRHG